jgi:hypothetical protein
MRREDIRTGERSLWGSAASLPVVVTDPVTMGEGCTPLVERLPLRRLDFHRQNKRTGPMPSDDRLGLHDRQGVRHAQRKSIKGGEDQTIEIAEGKPPRGLSSQHIEQVAQRQDLRLERSSSRKSPMTARQISLSKSPMGQSIDRFAPERHSD